MTKSYRVAILGATGAVGAELLSLLDTRNFPIADLKLLASPRSAGKTLEFKGESLPIEAVSTTAFQNIDIVLASAGSEASKTWAPVAVAAGCVVVDNSSAFRQDPQVPLVVPEVNRYALKQHQGIVANPNCTTILLSVVVYPLHRVIPIDRLVVSTYQSASGAGARAMAELENQAREILEGKEPTREVFSYPLAFNLFLHNSPVNDQGYCGEEMKMLNETRKIFAQPDLRLTATCVRVPVLRAHSEAVNIEFRAPFPVKTAIAVLKQSPGVSVVQDFASNYFPMPIDASGKDDVLVGRIRADLSHPNALELWLCGDQIRKGAALNAIQIAEAMIADQLL
ncbi:MAG: aspartate-semialdehyde dehydrogenase [Cyanobacteria bacterium M5B4]|nr:aspartate-semialdehyde dehydrogenase [Cyanobacteria bacterium KgW148]PLS68689.1 MAG: aspartate-semialdehyde dehydrogenase [Cyanobacteria bacterium M5B4]